MGSKTCDVVGMSCVLACHVCWRVMCVGMSCVLACHVPGFMYSCASAVGTRAEEDAGGKQQCCLWL